eukprot:180518-Hanusia_phi.AAC.1
MNPCSTIARDDLRTPLKGAGSDRKVREPTTELFLHPVELRICHPRRNEDLRLTRLDRKTE